MNIHTVIQSQYLASLKMLEQAVAACPDSLWNEEKDKNRFWHIAYHALFYCHLYLQPDEKDFIPWGKAGAEARSLGRDARPEPLNRRDLLEYLDFCRDQVRTVVPQLDLNAESGFDWLPFSKLEVQFYNIRHLMQHAGELMERLWVEARIEVPWVGMQAVE